jgi:hypothetical protein
LHGLLLGCECAKHLANEIYHVCLFRWVHAGRTAVIPLLSHDGPRARSFRMRRSMRSMRGGFILRSWGLSLTDTATVTITVVDTGMVTASVTKSHSKSLAHAGSEAIIQ